MRVSHEIVDVGWGHRHLKACLGQDRSTSKITSGCWLEASVPLCGPLET